MVTPCHTQERTEGNNTQSDRPKTQQKSSKHWKISDKIFENNGINEWEKS